MNSPETCNFDIADRLKLRAPVGDNQPAASAVLNEVLARSDALRRDLIAIGNRHFDAAPESSCHVTDLAGALAATVLDWIRRWPA